MPHPCIRATQVPKEDVFPANGLRTTHCYALGQRVAIVVCPVFSCNVWALFRGYVLFSPCSRDRLRRTFFRTPFDALQAARIKAAQGIQRQTTTLACLRVCAAATDFSYLRHSRLYQRVGLIAMGVEEKCEVRRAMPEYRDPASAKKGTDPSRSLPVARLRQSPFFAGILARGHGNQKNSTTANAGHGERVKDEWNTD